MSRLIRKRNKDSCKIEKEVGENTINFLPPPVSVHKGVNQGG